MFYPNVLEGTFLSRPNRFLANVVIDGREAVCHVKNTGRLKELLIPGTPVAVQFHPDAAAQGRKTEYSLIGAKKITPDGGLWVNIDSQAPNTAAFEWLSEGEGLPFCPRPENIKREVHCGASRFDLAFSYTNTPWYMEVKGVTLDCGGTAVFPDAPTERGLKHINELANLAANGTGAAILFVIQMKGIRRFSPNAATQPEFAAALRHARSCGVHIFAYDCTVTENSMKIDRPVPVVLG